MLSVNRVQFNTSKPTLNFTSGHYNIDPYLLIASCDPNALAAQLEFNKDVKKNNAVEGNGVINALKENYKTLIGILFDDKTTKEANKIDQSLTKIVQSGALNNSPKNKLNFMA